MVLPSGVYSIIFYCKFFWKIKTRSLQNRSILPSVGIVGFVAKATQVDAYVFNASHTYAGIYFHSNITMTKTIAHAGINGFMKGNCRLLTGIKNIAKAKVNKKYSAKNLRENSASKTLLSEPPD